MSNGLNRRAALRLGAGSGLTAALGKIGEALPRISGAPLRSAPPDIAHPMEPGADAKWRAKLKFMDVFCRRYGDGDGAAYNRKARVNEFDPDIACRRAMSPAIKAIVQRHRDDYRASVASRLRNKLGI